MLEHRLLVGSPDDAELVALGKKFEALYAAYWSAVDRMEEARSKTGSDAEGLDTFRMHDELQPFLKAISAIQAHTETGRRVKMLAVAFCLDCTVEGIEVLPDETDVQGALEASVARDFLRSHGVALRAPHRPEHKVRRHGSRAKQGAHKRRPAA